MSLCLVVGGAGGIGRLVKAELLELGWTVVTIDKFSSDVDFVCDASDTTALSATYARIVERNGLPACVVSCPGYYPNLLLTEYSESLVDSVLSDNFKATTTIVRLAIPDFVERGSGRFVLISSLAGHLGANDPYYAASKAAVIAFTKSVAKCYGSTGIRINCVCPGPTKTDMNDTMTSERIAHYENAIPIGRFCSAHEVASLCCYLVSDAPDCMHGSIMDIDGGLLRR